MSRLDDKQAFEAMMDEISDSDDDSPSPLPVKKASSAFSQDFAASSQPKLSQEASQSRQYSDAFKMTKIDQEIENFGVNSVRSPSETQSEQIGITKRWLMRPCNKGDRSMMKCFVERERSTLGLQTIYRLFAEGGEGQTARFLMSAKKKVNKQTSYYLISLELDPSDDRGSESVVGKVRGNTIGSRYLITDGGVAPDRTVAPSMLRKELGFVHFEFDSGGPSRIEAWIPAVAPGGVPAVWQPDSEARGLEAAVEEKRFDKLVTLRNKVPKWDEAHGGHVLNFQGRVTESSVKNFQLCCLENEDPEEVVLQFGRVAKHRFTMDLKYPLSPLQAFGICVGCLDGKIADRKGYEYLRRFSSSVTETASTATTSADAKDTAQRNSDGSMKGSSSITGMLREAMPSSQYIRDKLYRSFK